MMQAQRASFFERLLASFFDGIFVLIIGLIIAIFFSITPAVWLVSVIYFAVTESSSSGATFGKRMFGLRVTYDDGYPNQTVSFPTCLLREAIKHIVPFLILFTPLIGRTPWDAICSTQVIKVN
eukprot:NODE_10245_length_529_cov_27.854680_g9598_i0.p1 GENE.NODE_10245_length_529_cov_27.854680_g9598_i0~~NODE_10245_length_529_cov_27.854680_g9598_i0.p1  ORF type:complete len:123 (-),score=19.43 NODE_10245_length_529_cov_27.854680_g9598_i0:103-471(-)